MKTFLAIALTGAVSAMSEVENAFFTFITEYGKSYSTMEEYSFRFKEFTRAHEEIVQHNAIKATYKLGHNQMSDWTEEEYLSILTHQPMPEEEMNIQYHPEPVEGSSQVDWRSHGKVNAIKDQKQCGSCWAFSSVAALETAYAIKHGHLYSFSEQQLVDCEPKSHGCNGGLQSYAFKYYETHPAIEESAYSYTARTGTCKASSKRDTGIKTKSYVNVARNSASQMKSALNQTMLSVSIEADKSVFQRYSSGIFNSSACGTRLDHATDVVGWGSQGGTEYWIMRNSWGKSWGENGYMRLEIQSSGKGICGIQSEPLYPTV